jgi:serine/threonine protein kinase
MMLDVRTFLRSHLTGRWWLTRPINSGTKLGAYEITCAIGAGGMGEVYRARDAKLGRDVAIKVLRDAERMARFEREAKVLASLNHPNIAAIYGFDDSAGVHALVMELLEGPSPRGLAQGWQSQRIRSSTLGADGEQRLQSSPPQTSLCSSGMPDSMRLSSAS